jgi:succinoglycan biosynthesis protein ExoA
MTTSNNTQPDVSIVIPCRNERDHIETVLRSILTQDPPPGGFEVIIADGMSDDGTRSVLQRLATEDSRLRIVDNLQKITPSGMNTGIREARGRYIAIMGAHNRYAPDYLRRSVETLQKTGADNVGGAMSCEANGWVQRAIAAAHHSPFSVGGAKWHNVNYEGPTDTVFGGVYRREVFDRIGLFDEELVRNQDDEFNLRLIRAGGKIWQSPLIQSWYRPRASLLALTRQYKQYGYWKVRVIQKNALPSSVRHLVPCLFVSSLLILPVAALIWPLAMLLWLMLLFMYGTSIGVASVLTAARAGWDLLAILPIVFACYHFSYGYGFLRGIFDFLVLRRGPHPIFVRITRR